MQGSSKLLGLSPRVTECEPLGAPHCVLSRHQRLKDNNEEHISPKEMLAELSADNQALTRYFRSAHEVCEKYNDVATTSLIEVWIDQAERRTWFLSEIVRGL